MVITRGRWSSASTSMLSLFAPQRKTGATKTLALQTLDSSNIIQAGSLALSSSNLTDASDRQI
jgi:hypothetical protein